MMEEPQELPNAEEEDQEEMESGLLFQSFRFPPPPSSHGADAINVDFEKLGLGEKVAGNREVCAVKEEGNGRVGAFWIEETHEDKSEVEGVEKVSAMSKDEEEDVEKEELAWKTYSTPKDEEAEGKRTEIPYPQRPGLLDCAYYLRTGTCGYGANCKFNHPPRRRSTQIRPRDSSESVQKFVSKEENEELPEKGGKTECKFFVTPGGCKFGSACKFSHCQEKNEVLGIKLNFLGLPIRPGEKECPYYMHTGGCKFSSNCRFNHPDPTIVTAEDNVLGYQNGGSPKQHASIETNLPTNHFHRNSSQTVYNSDVLPSCIPSKLFHPKGLNFNPNFRSQVSTSSSLPPGRNIQQPSCTTLVSNSRAIHQQADMEYPERPGQPECLYFMKTGDCKFRSACKFHHPRSRLLGTSACNISPVGLPLRPDQPVCTFYNRFGICKFGPACKFNHPMDFASSALAAARSGEA